MAHQVVFFATASGTYAMAVAVPGGAAAAATLGRYADEFLGALSPAAKALDDAKSFGDAFQVYLNRDASGAFRVAGAVAASGLGGVFAAALVPWWVPVGTGLAVAVAGGFVASKLYEELFDGAAGSRIGDILLHEFWDDVFDTGVAVNTFFNQARNWVPARDPFALDLDGDGIETTGDMGRTTVLFDHDGDGILSGTGWLRGDDAWLVLDRDGDNRITSGAELFGVDTPLATGIRDTVTLANTQRTIFRDGFSAIAPLDTNRDGRIDAADGAVSGWSIRRDLNADGVIGANETRLAQASDLRIWRDLKITQLRRGRKAPRIARGEHPFPKNAFAWRSVRPLSIPVGERAPHSA